MGACRRSAVAGTCLFVCYTTRGVRNLGFLLLAAFLALLAADRSDAQPAWAGQCGIAANQTVWADYSWSSLLPVMARPGTVLALTNGGGGGADYSADARAAGAATYLFDIRMKTKVGTPQAPADPATIAAAAQAEYQTAVNKSGGCASPLVVENELFGASSVTPWAPANAQYRVNVLAYLQDLAQLGAHPVLLLAAPAYLGSPEAVSWWQHVAQVADIVREDYLPATTVWHLGPVLGNRFLRERYREAVGQFTAIGIPPSRLGIMVSVLTQVGGGGRNGLSSTEAWYQVVKWYALSAKQVAGELGLGSVFSWGWQQWNPSEVDATKEDAACAWLWARQPTLCDAPKKIGRSFEASRVSGQIVLPAGAFCRLPSYGTVGTSELAQLTAATGDRDAALSLFFERLVEKRSVVAPADAVLDAEQRVIGASFGGSRSAYLSALAQAHLTVAVARAALADEIRRARLTQTQGALAPKGSAVSAFYAAYPQLLVRRVHVSPAAPWLGGTRDGYAVAGTAPAAVFSAPAGHATKITTLLGTYSVHPEGAAVALGSLPIGAVRAAVVASLESFARAHAFERWTLGEQRRELDHAICRADELPEPAALDFTQYAPFLQAP
jgi:hypothetical protein